MTSKADKQAVKDEAAAEVRSVAREKGREFTVESPIQHDGRRYEIGEPITLHDEAQIAALLASSAISGGN